MVYYLLKKGLSCIGSSRNPVFLNSLYLLFSSMLSSATGFIFWVVVARFFSVADVGTASAIISTVGLIAVISLLGLDVTLVKYLSDNKYDRKELINSSVFLVMTMSLIVSVIALIIGYNQVNSFQATNIAIFSFTIIGLSIISSLQALQSQGIFVGLRQNKYCLYQNIMSTIRIGFVPILAFIGSLGIILAYGISWMLMLLLGFVFMRIQLNYFPFPRINKNILRSIFHFSLGNYVARIFDMMPTYVMPLIIITILDEEASAYFYVAWQISLLLLIISKSVSSSVLAEAVHDPQNIDNLLKRSTLLTFVLLIPAVFGICLIGKYLLLLFGNAYAENSYLVLVLLSLGSIPFSMNMLYSAACRIKDNIRSMLVIYGIIGIGTIVGSIYSLQKLGLNGGAYSWILANILSLLFVLFDSNKHRLTKDW